MSKSWEVLKKRLDAALGEKAPRGAVAEFCRVTGFARSSVQNWMEKGQSPTIENLDRIAKGLGMEERPWQLLRPEEPAKPGLALAPLPGLDKLIEELHKIDQRHAAKMIKIFRELLEPDSPEEAIEPGELPVEPGKKNPR